MDWYNIIGNVGVIFIVFAYLLLQLKKIKSENILYSVMNAVGAIFILISLVYEFNLSAILVEIFWIIISIYGIINTIIIKKRVEK